MTPGEEILYNTMCSIVSQMKELKEEVATGKSLAETEGMTIQDIAKHMKMSVSFIRKNPWILPFEQPKYGRSPYVYSRAQVARHLKLVDDKGLNGVKRMWQDRVRATRTDEPSQSSPGSGNESQER